MVVVFCFHILLPHQLEWVQCMSECLKQRHLHLVTVSSEYTHWYEQVSRFVLMIDDKGVHFITMTKWTHNIWWIPLSFQSISIADILPFLEMVRDYLPRSFVHLRKKNNRYKTFVIGQNSFDTLSRRIAADLGKSNPKSFTTHTVRPIECIGVIL